MIIFPVNIHLTIKIIYYKYFKETIKKYNYRLIFLIMIGEELLFLIFLFPFLCIHYISIPLYLVSLIVCGIIYGIKCLIEKCKK